MAINASIKKSDKSIELVIEQNYKINLHSYQCELKHLLRPQPVDYLFR